MVTYTSSSTYWNPLRPRIRIFPFNDKSYADPIYTYNAFADEGSEGKPIALVFDSQITSVGDFSIEIEDSGNTLDPDIFLRGNRVFIECSKDGITWEAAFKGLIRSVEQKIFASTGRNLILQGYSYLIRLNERVINTIKESAVTGDPAIYDRTDSTMFTDNLINDLLSTDSNYVSSVDDTQLYGVLEKNNITSSPIVEWIPRLDAQLISVSSAITRVLDFSNGLLMFNPEDDELMLYTADLVTPSTGIFTITNHANADADNGDYAMYPLAPYSYDISYDYPDSGSRLIGSIGNAGVCAPEPSAEVVTKSGQLGDFYVAGSGQRWIAPAVQFPSTVIHNLVIPVKTVGNNSSANKATVRIYDNNSADGYGTISNSVGSSFELYVNGIQGTAFPSVTTEMVLLIQKSGHTGPTVVPGLWYYLSVQINRTITSTANSVLWRTDAPNQTNHLGGRRAESYNNGVLWAFQHFLPGDQNPGDTTKIYHKWLFSVSPGPCGGTQSTQATDPIFAVAHDKNMSKRLGVVERVATSIPSYVKTAQTLNEYMFNQIYYSAKPRFTFDFPSLSMPNKLPKAGDIVAHVDTRVNVGTQTGPIQTGIINKIRYSFQQAAGRNSTLGLNTLALTTTGIKRGSY